MKARFFSYCTIIIACLTLIYSLYATYEISGSLFGKVKVVQLEEYGGVTFEHLWNFELWRLFASQLIHIKQYHMLFNVLSFALVGIVLEKYIGFARFFVLWFVSGTLGTLTKTILCVGRLSHYYTQTLMKSKININYFFV